MVGLAGKAEEVVGLLAGEKNDLGLPHNRAATLRDIKIPFPAELQVGLLLNRKARPALA
jgi:hypothetical protein